MKTQFRSISAKLFLLLLLVTLVIFSIHTYFNIRTTSSDLTDLVYSSADRASDLLARSTRYSMLLNRREDVHQIIRTVGSEPGFVEINIYNKNGEVTFSTDSLKVGHTVDLTAEACVICHSTGVPLVSVPTTNRMRVYDSPEHGRILGLINPIHNDIDCSTAACHAHGLDQNILGVLDVQMSLASVDERVAATTTTMILSSVAMMAVIASMSGVFIYRVVRDPIGRLMTGMRTIASGDLTARIDVAATDELGELAQSFNTMADDLSSAQTELRAWAHTLEDRIRHKTEELKAIQSQVLHMEKMASLGKLSASIAHEINNPLFGILMYAKLGLRELGDGDEKIKDEALRQYFSVIREESSRAGDIVRSLLAFAKSTGGKFAECSLNDVVEQTLSILAHHFALAEINVQTDLLDGDDKILCDAKQIQQAVIAMCMNAVEAMATGGSLTVGTGGDVESLSIRIADNGAGIPRESLSKIFEPFFTTKDDESSLGLGLSIVYGIVQRHQGRIDIDSEVGRGTTMTVTLPREPLIEVEDDDDTKDQEEAGSAESEASPPGSARVKETR